MTQIWKDIRGFKGLYQASNWGRVKSLKYRHTAKEQILKLSKRKNGYLVVTLCCKTYYVHRLIFETFYRRLLPNEDCHHLNEIRDCNLSTNLVARDESIHVGEHNKKRVVSEQTKLKISKSLMGHKFSQQTKQKISKARKGKNNPMFGKKHSQQTRRKMSDIRKGKKRTTESINKRTLSRRQNYNGKYFKEDK